MYSTVHCTVQDNEAKMLAALSLPEMQYFTCDILAARAPCWPPWQLCYCFITGKCRSYKVHIWPVNMEDSYNDKCAQSNHLFCTDAPATRLLFICSLFLHPDALHRVVVLFKRSLCYVEHSTCVVLKDTIWGQQYWGCNMFHSLCRAKCIVQIMLLHATLSILWCLWSGI